MFLRRNQLINPSGENPEFLNQTTRPVPMGMQRFLAKKGINSPEDLMNRLQFAPRVSFRRAR
ncbi:hypothetical protein [Desulfitobacterium sp.]|uniref:hypothetical protein n=1 Tax=Desulfitobacterium sp. TaxID=49981 RepID=UPI002B73BE2A|nr:hypothetical protein [Desulfitobacterium sp.]HVJ50190.1 hypothetical protein [Desulfitobacterium sp.]